MDLGRLPDSQKVKLWPCRSSLNYWESKVRVTFKATYLGQNSRTILMVNLNHLVILIWFYLFQVSNQSPLYLHYQKMVHWKSQLLELHQRHLLVVSGKLEAPLKKMYLSHQQLKYETSILLKFKIIYAIRGFWQKTKAQINGISSPLKKESSYILRRPQNFEKSPGTS